MSDEKELYLKDFERLKSRDGQDPQWLQRLRDHALDRFASLPFPTTHDEEWRFTSIAPILKVPFRAVFKPPLSHKQPDGIHFGEDVRLVFIDGYYNRRLSSVRRSEERRVGK